MTVIIRELIIRARIEDAEYDHAPRHQNNNSTSDMENIDFEKLVAVCVEKTLLVMERKQER